MNTAFRMRIVLSLLVLGLALAPCAASAICSVIPPQGFDQRGYLGSLTSPFLAADITTDVRVVGAVCDQQTRSAAPGFRVGGATVGADEFVVTIAYTPANASTPAPILVLGADPGLCAGLANCTVDTLAEREIVEIPLPGGSFERRLRFRYPAGAPAVGPAQLAVRLASSPAPVAADLRTQGCQTHAAGTDVACIGDFYALDGSCRTGAAYVNEPFSGLVAIPRTDFLDICTGGCDGLGGPAISSTLPVTTDRAGNVLFSLIYDSLLVRVDRGDGLIEPRPRRLRLSIDDAANNGFADTTYAAKPSSFTYEGASLSPPFNGFVDPTVPPGTSASGAWWTRKRASSSCRGGAARTIRRARAAPTPSVRPAPSARRPSSTSPRPARPSICPSPTRSHSRRSS